VKDDRTDEDTQKGGKRFESPLPASVICEGEEWGKLSIKKKYLRDWTRRCCPDHSRTRQEDSGGLFLTDEESRERGVLVDFVRGNWDKRGGS